MQTTVKNLLFITVDQWRADYVGALNPSMTHTPNIDSLIRRGVHFRNHYVQSAPCGPSRASIHTGLLPSQHGVWRNGDQLQPVWNWASSLRARGYEPALIGYTHTARPLPDEDGRGFEGILPDLALVADLKIDGRAWTDWVLERHPEAKLILKDLKSIGELANTQIFGGYQWGQAQYSFEWTDSAYLATAAANFIESHRNKPWILHLSLFRPHDPYIATAEFLTEGRRMTARRGPANAEAALAAHPFLNTQIGNPRFDGRMETKTLNEIRAHYTASVSEMDAGVGTVLDALDEFNLSDSTLVILTSDHGDQLGDHWAMGKLGIWDQSYHVPLIIADPRPVATCSHGKEHVGFTQSIDIAPTISEYFGCHIPSNLQGFSLQEAVLSPEKLVRFSALWSYEYERASDFGSCKRLYAIRNSQFLFAVFDDIESLLIDYDNDGENAWINRANSRKYRSTVTSLFASLSKVLRPSLKIGNVVV